MSDIQVRHTVESLFALKLSILHDMEAARGLEQKIQAQFESMNGYSPYRITDNFQYCGDDRAEKAVDQAIWSYLVRLYNLEKYMLCTDYKKLLKEIEACSTPKFTVETANGWLAGLQGLILENVTTLVHDVYARVVNGSYYTGGGYRGERKKRNNNGIDKRFILHTRDYNGIMNYWSSSPSIMDDLEKVCYLLDGKTLPEETLRSRMRDGKVAECSDDYMTVRLCQNGNTHFILTDATRDALNRYGPTGATIGENIKIKVFPDRWAS